jgi:glycerophosphoryl diester phosphodiesterase
MSPHVLERVRSVSRSTGVQAHRGSPDPASGVRENTLEAFARARALGADGVELAGVGAIHELTTGELPAHVPLLAQALDVCDGLVVNIEIKNLPTEPAFDPTERCTGGVVDLVAAIGSGDSVIISSFWSGALGAVRSAGSPLRTGLLVLPWFDVPTAIAAAVDLDCSAVHLPVGLVTAASVEAAHAAGLSVAVWTVVDERDLAVALAAGADTVVTDDVAMARRVVDGS